MSEPQGRHPRAFGHVRSAEYEKKKIAAIEGSDGRRLTLYQLAVIARAFGLPDDFFRRHYPDTASLTLAYESAIVLPADVPHNEEVSAERVAAFGAVALGFRQIATDEPVPEVRREAAQKLTSLICQRGKVLTSLVLLEGRTGSGKTFFVGHWFRDHGKALFGGNALSIDCTSKSLDQVSPLIADWSNRRMAGNAKPTGVLGLAKPTLIVLDGLHVDRTPEGTVVVGPTFGHPQRVDALVDLVAMLLNSHEERVVILSVANNLRAIGHRPFNARLSAQVEFNSLSVSPLSDEDGARFLLDLGVPELDDRRLKMISRRLQGMPLALAVAADDLTHLSGADREGYLDTSGPSLSPNVSPSFAAEFSGFFSSWLARQPSGKEAQQDAPPSEVDPSPHALLRLLSMMPGPLPRTHLAEIVSDGRIRRLKRLSVETVFRCDMPFLSAIDDQIDLHAMVRGILRAELDGFIRTDSYDEYTSRGELEWIHWKCALLSWRALKGEREADSYAVATVESFVYHMIAQAKLLPASRKRQPPKGFQSRRRHLSGVSQELIDRFEGTFGALSNSQLWDFAHQKAARPFLLENNFVATRVYGQYEAKARILKYLVDAANEEHIPVVREVLTELEKEISVCWLHAGRLNMAKNAIHRAALLSDLNSVGAIGFHDIAIRSQGPRQTLWRVQCDIASVRASVDTRLGRVASEVSRSLDPYVAIAEGICGTSRSASGDQIGWTPPLVRGALRILIRQADLLLQCGDTEGAIHLFEVGMATQMSVKGRILDGEAARRYAVALIRTREIDPGRMALAQRLILGGLESFGLPRDHASSPTSNDIIPFLTLSAAFHRIEGDLAAALKALCEVRRHELLQKGECTFVAAREVDLEELRLEIVQVGPNATTYLKAMALATRLANANHLIMHNEARLLAAEACADSERPAILAGVTAFCRRTEWRLRLEDVAELTRHGSAVARFGL